MLSLLWSSVSLLYLLLFVIMTKIDLADVLSGLKLSSDVKVHLRGEQGYIDLTKRWTQWKAPDYAAVVEVASEKAVADTVRFANTHNIPFLAQSGAHGDTTALGALKDGIQIHMRGLNSFNIAPDETYVTVGGGIKGTEIRNQLWEKNKWTVHGCCECPGLTAVALGGGHGLLQGRYGLLSDQILALNVVLANATAIKVSNTSHPDLFWAMQGAGHNFGIVTSLDYKIYNIPNTDVGGRIWSYEMLTYDATPENVKKVYGLSKEMLDDGSQPDGLIIYGVVAIVPQLGTKPVLMQYSKLHILLRMGRADEP
tara:strand:+ start:23133 stop:24065 length:933 start_codon:yes stop_codon:yes gene_type:complete